MLKLGLRPEARGHDPEASLKAVAELEPTMLASGRSTSVPFHVVGKWCISEHLLRRLFWGSDRRRAWAELRSISNLTPLMLAALLPARRTISAPSQASALVLRTNIRAIYPDLGVTAKLANPERANTGITIRHEANSRGQLKATPLVDAPRLHAAGDVPVPFILEDFIVGAERLRAKVPEGWASNLFNFYVANGLDARPLGDVVDWRSIVETVARGCDELDVPLGEDVDAFIHGPAGKTSIERGHVLQGFCHGDLAPSNLFFLGQRALIADWEYGERNQLMSDIVRLAILDDCFRKEFLVEAGAYGREQSPHLLAPATQLVAGCLVAASQRIERFQGLLEFAPRASLTKSYGAKVGSILGLAGRILRANEGKSPAEQALGDNPWTSFARQRE